MFAKIQNIMLITCLLIISDREVAINILLPIARLTLAEVSRYVEEY